jgi:hypothetical protein
MSVSLVLGLVYLISELLLTVTRRSRTRFFASGAHCNPATAPQLMHRNRLMMVERKSFNLAATDA